MSWYYITNNIQVVNNIITTLILASQNSFTVLHLDLFKSYPKHPRLTQDLSSCQWVLISPACPSQLVETPWGAVLRRMLKASKQVHHSPQQCLKWMQEGGVDTHTRTHTHTHTHTPLVYTRQWNRQRLLSTTFSRNLAAFSFFPLFSHSYYQLVLSNLFRGLASL